MLNCNYGISFETFYLVTFKKMANYLCYIFDLRYRTMKTKCGTFLKNFNFIRSALKTNLNCLYNNIQSV